MRALLSRGFGVARQKEMERSFAEAAGQKLEVLIVLGGDGTIRTAAEACAEKGSYLIPLPGGTMNMLPRALYGDVAWEESLKNTLAAPSLKVLSGGRIAGKQFLIAAIVGAPALLAEPRESMREGNIVDAIEKGSVAFRKMFETKVQYLISGEMKGEAEAVALICPLISEQMSDSEQALEAAVVDVESAAEVIGLVSTAAFGKWRDDRNILLTKTKRVECAIEQRYSCDARWRKVNLGRSAEINFVSEGTYCSRAGLSLAASIR